MKTCLAAAVLLVTLGGALTIAAAENPDPQPSPRMERAKDLIADEQWDRAIEQLTAAAQDLKERNRDEALFWLAHSHHQNRDLTAAVQTVSQLERLFPASRWVKPARSLRIEIAQKLRRNDVLWFTAQPAPRAPNPAPPIVDRPPSPMPPAPPEAPPRGRPARRPPGRAAPAEPAPAAAPAAPRSPRASAVGAVTAVSPAAPADIWVPEGWEPDVNQRILALGSLMESDASRVIPILKDIALRSPDPNEARRAIFVLAQSGRAEAHSSVLDVARRGSELVQIAAVRELGRFGGAHVPDQLLQVYGIGNPRVKYQIVTSLGERAATGALLRIAENERDRRLQESAIVRLGQAGARQQLEHLYARASAELKRPIIIGLFNARAEEELIRIAESDRDPAIRAEAASCLQLLGTPGALAYIERTRTKR